MKNKWKYLYFTSACLGWVISIAYYYLADNLEFHEAFTITGIFVISWISGAISSYAVAMEVLSNK